MVTQMNDMPLGLPQSVSQVQRGIATPPPVSPPPPLASPCAAPTLPPPPWRPPCTSSAPIPTAPLMHPTHMHPTHIHAWPLRRLALHVCANLGRRSDRASSARSSFSFSRVRGRGRVYGNCPLSRSPLHVCGGRLHAFEKLCSLLTPHISTEETSMAERCPLAQRCRVI